MMDSKGVLIYFDPRVRKLVICCDTTTYIPCHASKKARRVSVVMVHCSTERGVSLIILYSLCPEKVTA